MAAETGPDSPGDGGRTREVALLMLRLGVTAFGGPAAHIAMLRQEVVDRRRWLEQQHFLDLLGITNLIPGPNSTELVMHVGHDRAGRRGLVVAGVCFIAPAAVITLAFAVAYDRYGTTTGGEWLLYGVKPVIIAVVGQAVLGLGRAAVNSPWQAALCVVVIALYLAGTSEILLLVFGAVVGGTAALARRAKAPRATGPAGLVGVGAVLMVPRLLLGLPAVMGVAADATVGYGAARLFFTFLKIGSVLYGSGYVLLAFLRNDFVERYGWLSERQLLDAVAVGQFTPGPVFSTATFVGYLVAGVPGAVLATVGIFLPAFLFVAVTHPLLPRLRRSPVAAALLDGVNLAAVGLMAAVGWELGRTAVVDVPTVFLAVGAAALLIRSGLNSAWLVLGGSVAGVAIQAVGLA